MRATYYSEKTVAQCMSALNERLQQKGTASRPGMEGWVEKNGSFALGITTKVANRFPRTTRLQGKAERLGGVTVVKISVADGVTPRERVVILGALALVGVFLAITGNLLPGLVAVVVGVALNIPLAGDHQNSQILIADVQRTLKAKETPPVVVKKATEAKKVAPAKKPAATIASKSVAVKKPSPASASAARKPATPKTTRPPTSSSR